MEASLVEWELVAILVTLIGGFGSLAYMLGKRNSDLDQVQIEISEVKKSQADHAKDCKDIEARRQEESKGIQEKLHEGSVKFALLENGQKRLEEGQNRIEHILEMQFGRQQ